MIPARRRIPASRAGGTVDQRCALVPSGGSCGAQDPYPRSWASQPHRPGLRWCVPQGSAHRRGPTNARRRRHSVCRAVVPATGPGRGGAVQAAAQLAPPLRFILPATGVGGEMHFYTLFGYVLAVVGAGFGALVAFLLASGQHGRRH